jgi:hypothetical protein
MIVPAVVVYGATPSGCAAAVAAARLGLLVTLIDPGIRVGGMTSGGLGHTDLGLEGRELGGITQEFYSRVSQHYMSGPASGPANASTQCFAVESHVAETVYVSMLTEANVDIHLGHTLESVHKVGSVLLDITVVSTAPRPDPAGSPLPPLVLAARVFIDASYEGDLMAMANVSFTVGREARVQFNETDAGRLEPNNVLSRYQFQQPIPHTDAAGDLLPLIYRGPVAAVGAADSKVTAYTYRPCMTKLAGGGGVPIQKPSTYDSRRWELFRRLLAANPQSQITDFLYLAGPLGNSTGDAAKFDVGTNGAISLDFIGGSWDYPTANRSARAAIVEAHVQHVVGFIHFLSTDPAVPEALRAETASYGWCADEFLREGHFPRSALYVREARRMVGGAVFTEADHVSSVIKADTVGLGSYNMDCHMTERISVNKSWVLNEGWLTKDFAHAPFELPYSLMLPRETEASNLIVPVAVSATHVAFSGIRLEPTWSILGHAAGVAAALAANSTRHTPVQHINVSTLQAVLVSQGQLLTVSSIPAEAPHTFCG